MPYGFDDTAWNAAKEEAKEILAGRARLRGMMAYSDLAQQITALNFDAGDPRFNRWFLREVSVEENRAGRGMMTALVVHRDGDMKPGSGFYELAEELGLDTSDITACWVHQLHRVHRAWAG
jgi:hypothetical protein